MCMGFGGWGRNPQVNRYKPSAVAHGGNHATLGVLYENALIPTATASGGNPITHYPNPFHEPPPDGSLSQKQTTSAQRSVLKISNLES